MNVNTAMAKFSPKAQATQGVGQTVKPAVKPAYTYQAHRHQFSQQAV